MKKIIIYVFSIIILIGCGKSSFVSTDTPSTIKTYCQSSPNKTINYINFLYNKNKVITETYEPSGNKKNFEYNSDNSIASQILEMGLIIKEKIYIYI